MPYSNDEPPRKLTCRCCYSETYNADSLCGRCQRHGKAEPPEWWVSEGLAELEDHANTG